MGDIAGEKLINNLSPTLLIESEAGEIDLKLGDALGVNFVNIIASDDTNLVSISSAGDVIVENGNVGIGEPIPDHKLHIGPSSGQFDQSIKLEPTDYVGSERSSINFADKFNIGNDSEGNGTADFFIFDLSANEANNRRLQIDSTGKTVLQNEPTAVNPVLEINQNDDDEAFVDFKGTSSTDDTKSITTRTSGASIQGFIRIKINGTTYWMPFYNTPTS